MARKQSPYLQKLKRTYMSEKRKNTGIFLYKSPRIICILDLEIVKYRNESDRKKVV